MSEIKKVRIQINEVYIDHPYEEVLSDFIKELVEYEKKYPGCTITYSGGYDGDVDGHLRVYRDETDEEFEKRKEEYRIDAEVRKVADAKRNELYAKLKNPDGVKNFKPEILP